MARTITKRGAGENGPHRLEPLDQAEFEGAVKKLRDDARVWIDQEISPQRERAWAYYNGEVDQQAPEDRSKAVLTEVRDAVEAVMVSLLRIFLMSDRPIEFEPEGEEDEPLAAQMADVCIHILMRKNRGFLVLSDTFRDALVAKAGILKVWWSDAKKIAEQKYVGLDQEELDDLMADDEVEILEIEERVEEETLEIGETVELPMFDLKIRRLKVKGMCKVGAIPPDEFIWNKTAKCLEEAILQGQDRIMYAQDAVNEGFCDWDDVSRAGAHGQSGDYTKEQSSRAGVMIGGTYESEEIDIASKRIRVSELYVRLDKDGDGIPELRRVIMIGDVGLLTFEEVWDDTPYSMGSPFPTPHFPLGVGIGDLTKDLQEIATAVQRCMLDSLYQACNPRYEAVSNQVNLSDLAKNEFNGIVRTRAPGMIRDLTVPFVGKDTLPVLQYLEGRREMRTGISKASQGLDPKQLQSSTESGVLAVFTAAQAKVESIARSLAETLVGPAIQKMARLLTKYQKRDLTIKLRGEWVKVPVDTWIDMDVVANVGIGNVQEQDDMDALAALVTKQENILQVVGSDNPIVSLEQYANGLSQWTKRAGFRDTQNYFNPPEIVEELQQIERQEEEANPDDGLDAETRAKLAQDQAKMQMDMQKQQQEMQLKQADQQFDHQLKREEFQAKLELMRAESAAKLQLEREKATAELNLKTAEFEAEAALEVFKVKTQGEGPGVGDIPTQ